MGLLDKATKYGKKLAEQQKLINLQTAEDEARLNRINQNNLYGNIRYVRDPVTGQYTQTASFNPHYKRQFDRNRDLSVNLGNQVTKAMSHPLDFDSLTALPEVTRATREAEAKELYKSEKEQIDKAYERGYEMMNQDLANRGIGLGNERGIKNAYDAFNKSWGDVYSNAWTKALGQATRAQQVDFDLALAKRQQEQNEMESAYYNPLKAYAAATEANSALSKGLLSGMLTPGQVGLKPTDLMGTTASLYGSLQSAENAKRAAHAQIAAAKIGAAARRAQLEWERQKYKDDLTVARGQAMDGYDAGTVGGNTLDAFSDIGQRWGMPRIGE